MVETAADRGPAIITKVLIGQIGTGAVLAGLFWGVYGHVAGYSALLGGLICVAPNTFLAIRLALVPRALGARALVRAAYIGELGKLALTALLFGVVFVVVKPLAVLPLFAGFIVAQLVVFAGLLMRDEVSEESAP